MIPHIHTLFEFISIVCDNQHQPLNIKKINRGQIGFREYWITLLQPMTVMFSYWLRNVTFNTIVNCSQKSNIGPLGLLLKYFSTSLLLFIPPLLRSFYYNKIRTNILFPNYRAKRKRCQWQLLYIHDCLYIASALIRLFWPLVCFSDWFHKHDSHTIWESKKSNL